MPTYSDDKSAMASNFYKIMFHEDIIVTTVTTSASVVDLWISKVYRSHEGHLNKLLVGLDIEWRPNLEPNSHNPAAIIQICIGLKCLIFQFLHADAIPASLGNFLSNSNFIFVGVGVREDAKKLKNDHNLIVGSTMDVAEKAAEKYQNPELARIGLKRLAFELIGKVMEKAKIVTLSPWDAQRLSYSQIEYATIDAYVSFLLGLQVSRKDELHVPITIEFGFTAFSHQFIQYHVTSSTEMTTLKMDCSEIGFIPITHYPYCDVPATAVAYPLQLTPSFWIPNWPQFPSDLAAVGYPLMPMLPSTSVTGYPNMASLPSTPFFALCTAGVYSI